MEEKNEKQSQENMYSPKTRNTCFFLGTTVLFILRSTKIQKGGPKAPAASQTKNYVVFFPLFLNINQTTDVERRPAWYRRKRHIVYSRETH